MKFMVALETLGVRQDGHYERWRPRLGEWDDGWVRERWVPGQWMMFGEGWAYPQLGFESLRTEVLVRAAQQERFRAYQNGRKVPRRRPCP